MAKNQRVIAGFHIEDPGQIKNVEHNPASGGRKAVEIGPHLLPLPIISGGVLAYTTAANTAPVALGELGKCLALYNNSATLASVTLGEDSTITSLAAGATDAAGHVGIPCPPNSWTKISCGMQNYVITSAATLLVYLVDDHSAIKQEAATFKGN